jgi:hypothetical protein
MLRITPALLLVGGLASSGCLRSTTVIEIDPDGSGTIVQETGMTSQALAMMKGLASSNQSGGSAPPEVFGEQQARTAAANMGVRFVSGEPFKTGELEGYRARFAFDDVTKIAVNMDQGRSPLTAGQEKQSPPFSFAFDRRAASSLLTIQMPSQMGRQGSAFPGLPGAGPGGSDADKAQATQALAMMKMMMKGLFVDVSLNVKGRILKTNAPYVQGSQVTLLQVDFDKLLADAGAFEKLQAATDPKSLGAVPGIKMIADPKLTVEFAR